MSEQNQDVDPEQDPEQSTSTAEEVAVADEDEVSYAELPDDQAGDEDPIALTSTSTRVDDGSGIEIESSENTTHQRSPTFHPEPFNPNC